MLVNSMRDGCHRVIKLSRQLLFTLRQAYLQTRIITNIACIYTYIHINIQQFSIYHLNTHHHGLWLRFQGS